MKNYREPMPKSRRDFLKLMSKSVAGAWILSALRISCKIKTTDKKPNIIYVLADDLGYGDLGCYGQKRIKTPNIDRMAEEGMRFTQHYAGSTVCAPSRCSLMTGLHTGHTYVRGNKGIKPMGQLPLPSGTLTIASILKKVGYITALIGKWGLGGPESTGIPNKQGFDYFFGYLCQRHAHNYYPEFLFRNEDRVSLAGNRIAEPRPDGAGVAIDREVYSHDLFTQEALNFITENIDKQFFLFLSITIPHANNEAGEKGMEVPDYGIYKDENWPSPEVGKAAMISKMDTDIGKIFEKLRELGLEKDTLVIFTSDNGPHREGGVNPEFHQSSGLLRGIKRDLYEGGIRVPMIAHWPGKIKAGSETDLISAFWDVLPTLAELTSAEIHIEIDGISFIPTLFGKIGRQQYHDYLYWEFHEGPSKQAIRMGNWKAVKNSPSGPIELYNLHLDIAETNDVARQNQEVVRIVERLFVSARTPSEYWSFKI